MTDQKREPTKGRTEREKNGNAFPPTVVNDLDINDVGKPKGEPGLRRD